MQKVVPFALLAALCLLVYSNGYEHAYNLDDGYLIPANEAIREVAPTKFFTDPATYNSYRPNVDYRPLITLSHALNYWWGGYDTWSWHLVQIALHWGCCCLLFVLFRRVVPGADKEEWPLVAACLFAVHPLCSGVVMYFSARSALMISLFGLAALLCFIEGRDRWALLFVMACLFTKETGVAVLGALGAHEYFLGGRKWRRFVPFALGALCFFVLRHYLMLPFPFEATRNGVTTPYQYAITEAVVWWEYVGHIVFPAGLVADDGGHTVYSTVTCWPVLLALAAWGLVAACLFNEHMRRHHPEVCFLAVAAAAWLSPSSSVVPLAEVINEHRPYLFSGITLGLIVRCLLACTTGWRKPLLAAGVMLCCLTLERNQVYFTPLSYWGDVVAKANPAPRAENNYALALQKVGRWDEASAHIMKARELSPGWFISAINLGLEYERQGDIPRAAACFSMAQQQDRYSGMAERFATEFALRHREGR